MESKFQIEWISDPGKFSINTLLAHTDFHPVGAREISLNGKWHFNYSVNPDSVNWDFTGEEMDCRAWKYIEVPSHIQLEGYDRPHYTNRMYPWDGVETVNYPQVPKRFNPVGQYVKYFSLEKMDERVFIRFEGVETGFALWVNGVFVGYSEDSYTPTDFELTDYVRGGENKLAVAVFKFTTGSWLEDQDFWRMSGIMRDVYLYFTPVTRIRDFYFQTDVTPSDRSVSADLKIYTENAQEETVVCSRILDRKGNPVPGSEGGQPVVDNQALLHSELKSVQLWDAEHSNLYTLEIQLKNADTSIQKIHYTVGFKRSEIIDGVWYINGKRLVINGVNRHDFSHVHGRSVTHEEMEWDIRQMKRHNINAVRTCHYPNQTYLYELCSRYGIYVMDETNLETHGTWQYSPEYQTQALPGSHPEWRDIVVSRADAMFQRDKNLPCVISWSLGNESYGGENFRHMREIIRRYDPLTPIHYEGVWHCREFFDVTDVISAMYRPVNELRKLLATRQDKPVILCEYSHAMGNSCGGMAKYIELTEEQEQYQGGFIWDFIDQAIETKDNLGRRFLGFGGDFGDRPNDGNFCINGLIFGDRTLSPKMQLVKNNYQNARFTITSNTMTVWNKSLFTNLNEYHAVCTLARNGEEIRRADMEISVAPQQTASFPVPFEKETLPGEYTITLSLQLKEDTLWEKRGYEVMFGQGTYRIEQPAQPIKKGTLRIVDSEINLGVYGDGFSCLFARKRGEFVSYKIGEEEMISSVPRPNFWRAPTDNDNGCDMPYRMATWRSAGKYALVSGFETERLENSIAITYTYHLATFIPTDCRVRYEVFPDGRIKTTIEYKGKTGLPQMPEYGLMWHCDRKYHNLKWYGFGPDDTYVDTVQGAKLGIFTAQVSDGIKPYVIPQESGNKCGVRWMEITDDRGRGMRLTATQPLEISATPYTPDMVEACDRVCKLPESTETVLRISKRMGIGGDDSWGARPLEEYCISGEKDHTLIFTIEPMGL